MATGYTHIIGEKDVTFEEFALRCARNFGALVMMRDLPLDAPIPEKFVPTDYHEKEVTKAKARLLKVQLRTKDETLAEWRERREAALAGHSAAVERAATLRARYEAMIAKAREWRPPTAEHEGLKAFMIEQLESSLEFDCREPEPPTFPTDLDEYNHAEAEAATRSLAYHTKAHAEECERTGARNAWVRALRESLAAPGGKGGAR